MTSMNAYDAAMHGGDWPSKQAASPVQEAVPLTDEQIAALHDSLFPAPFEGHKNIVKFSRALLALATPPAQEAAVTQQPATSAVPLTEPVTLHKALRAHRQAEVWLDGGTEPVCCVGLVNIQLTGWNRHTPSEAKAFADGFNDGTRVMRNALAAPIAPEPAQPQAAGVEAPSFAAQDNSECKFASGGARCVSHCGDCVCLAAAKGTEHD